MTTTTPPTPKSCRRWLQFSLREIFGGVAALAVSLWLFRVAAHDVSEQLFPLTRDWPPLLVQIKISNRFIALSLGVVILGGAVGAVIGRAFGGDNEGGSIMGVFIGCLVSFLGLIMAAIADLILSPG